MNLDELQPLPELRPVRLQGKAYYAELRRILKDIGYDLKHDAEAIEHEHGGRFTIKHLCLLALRYRLNLKATAEYLEDVCFLPAGAYAQLRARGLRPQAALREVWAEMQDTEPLAPWQQALSAYKQEAE